MHDWYSKPSSTQKPGSLSACNCLESPKGWILETGARRRRRLSFACCKKSWEPRVAVASAATIRRLAIGKYFMMLSFSVVVSIKSSCWPASLKLSSSRCCNLLIYLYIFTSYIVLLVLLFRISGFGMWCVCNGKKWECWNARSEDFVEIQHVQLCDLLFFLEQCATKRLGWNALLLSCSLL